MRAVRLFAPGDVRCVEIELPQIEKDNDVIIKVKACGVCSSDIIRVMEKGAHRYPITIPKTWRSSNRYALNSLWIL
jgi:threonine dehydrogenase-like Zn-dependent dehydrogenase